MRSGLVFQAVPIAKMFLSSCRKRGLTRTLRLGAHEFWFDLTHGTRTSGVVELDTLEIDSPSVAVGNKYEGSNPLFFRELMQHLPASAHRGTFLDYGAGKGRAMVLALAHGFTRVIGVEFSSELCAAAERNLQHYRASHPSARWELHCHDAATFVVPDEVDVAYFFNPFQRELMAQAVKRLDESWSRRPRLLFVMYANPYFVDLFEQVGFRVIARQGNDGIILRRSAAAVG